jgi:DNA-binding GntR family transcriptional regulator
MTGKPKTIAPDDGRRHLMHHEAVRILRARVQSGEFSPGDRLREVLLSQQLGMSRTPVREALRTLAAEGLVRLLPNRSVVVADIVKDESVDVFLVLGALEALAAHQACLRITDGELREVQRLHTEMEHWFEVHDRPRYTESNRAIHRLMVEASRNPSLIAAWRLITPRAEYARVMSNVDRRRWAIALDSHRKILAALLARSGHLLSALMQAHFAQSIVDGMLDRGGMGAASPSDETAARVFL